jgi:hypothetical protein
MYQPPSIRAITYKTKNPIEPPGWMVYQSTPSPRFTSLVYTLGDPKMCPCGGTGRRAGFKIPFSQGSGSSILPGGTIFDL